ncbi:MAG: zinc-ribbon domain-containing protein [bacterium]|nr:zinc-ribbon domain-containing protein [bacterium]
MMIKFSCPQCGTRFSVDEKLAGKVGHCKHCSHRIKVPAKKAPRNDVAISGRFRLASPETGVPKEPSPDRFSKQSSSSSDGRGAQDVNHASLGLLPTTNANLKPIPSDLESDDESGGGDNGDYKLAPIDEDRRIFNQMLSKHTHRQVFSATKVYGKVIGNTLGLLEGLSQFAFVVTWFFGMMVLFGAAAGQRGWAVTGATVIVILSIAQIALNFVYLFLMPFKGSPKKALQFFLPPYKKNQRRQVTKAVLRLLAPAVPVLGLVILFAFVPALDRGNASEQASFKQRVGAEAGELKREIGNTLRQGTNAAGQRVEDAAGNLPKIDLNDLQNRPRQGVEQQKP